MAEAKLRIKQKRDTEANWLKATTFIPLEGELIIYDVDSTHSAPRFKVGDGVKVVGDLPFADKNFAKLSEENTFTGNNTFNGLNTFNGSAEFKGIQTSISTAVIGSIYNSMIPPTPDNAITIPKKGGTMALTSDVPSFNNFTLLTSKPSDWATNYNAYYTKGDFGFVHNLGDSTWAANKFYSATPAEIDIQTLTQPIKIQVSGTSGWGEYGGLNLSYGRAKLYGIDNSFDDNVGYIDISNGRLTSAVYKADFTLSNPAGGGYGFSVKDTSALFSVGLNKSQAGDYAQQYYCNIGAPLNVTQIHGFTQLTSQPSDWSTKYGYYYSGFDTFNENSNFFGRSDGLYKPTNDILLNVGEGYKIQLYGKYKSNINTNYSNITLSGSGISLDCAQELSLNTLTSFSMVSNTADLSAKSVLSLACDSSKLYGSNRFGLTVSGQKAIGIDTSSTSANNLIRFEMTPKFNTNKIKGMAGNDLTLPASAGILAHIPTGTATTALLFGGGVWKNPTKINDAAFSNFSGDSSIYAPISTPEFYSNAQTNMTTAFCTFTKGQTAPTFLAPSSLVNRYVLQTHTKISNATEVSWTINYGLRANFTSFTIGTSHKDGRRVTRTCNVADFIYEIDNAYVDVTGASSNFQFRITNMGTSSTTFGIKNNSYNNLTGEFFIIFHYVF